MSYVDEDDDEIHPSGEEISAKRRKVTLAPREKNVHAGLNMIQPWILFEVSRFSISYSAANQILDLHYHLLILSRFPSQCIGFHAVSPFSKPQKPLQTLKKIKKIPF